ncbi:hypothetical protein NEOLEDRAFT_1180758 [Neolentinus lepideus HHB14362 ss-1]|uniref:Uncharacterized protein n=1 Tax=Neolentinus lepideus HHB14362 ss-1 TaxID=1314782 RepID=A0A165QNY8_9AGAM|nr:hypothetical protein NEOLEDRAFT_1180758 [Neolentinus lepideus HHB14362 ss-1]
MDTTENGKRERLEVEDEETREARIHDLLTKINASSSSAPRDASSVPSERPHAVDPPSELLSRVQAFLPQLAASNADLESRARADPGSVDIENVAEEAGQYIEMNLGLGVFEARRSSSSSSSSLSSSTSEPDSSSSSDENSDSESACSEGIATRRVERRMRRPMRPLPRRAIVEVDARASSVPPQ